MCHLRTFYPQISIFVHQSLEKVVLGRGMIPRRMPNQTFSATRVCKMPVLEQLTAQLRVSSACGGAGRGFRLQNDPRAVRSIQLTAFLSQTTRILIRNSLRVMFYCLVRCCRSIRSRKTTAGVRPTISIHIFMDPFHNAKCGISLYQIQYSMFGMTISITPYELS